MSFTPLTICLATGRHVFVVIAPFALAAMSPIFANTELNIPGYQMIWHDEFQGDAVDAAKWTVNVGANVAYRRASDGRWVEEFCAVSAHLCESFDFRVGSVK